MASLSPAGIQSLNTDCAMFSIPPHHPTIPRLIPPMIYQLITHSPNTNVIIHQLMNNSSLVNNTDRVYGEQDPLQKANNKEYIDTEPEWSIWLKIIGLILFTYGLIVAFYAMSTAIEKNNGQLDSFETGGGIILAFFCVYVIIAAFAWYKGSSQRDVMKREAVERELELEKEAMEGAY